MYVVSIASVYWTLTVKYHAWSSHLILETSLPGWHHYDPHFTVETETRTVRKLATMTHLGAGGTGIKFSRTDFWVHAFSLSIGHELILLSFLSWCETKVTWWRWQWLPLKIIPFLNEYLLSSSYIPDNFTGCWKYIEKVRQTSSQKAYFIAGEKRKQHATQ